MKAPVNRGKQPSGRAPDRTAAPVAPTTSDPTGALTLQRNIGNRATRDLFDPAGGRDDAGAAGQRFSAAASLAHHR